MTDKKEESLKPCPFCGKKAELEDTDNVHLCCIDGDWYLNNKSWNNAYCWKEIDSLKARIEELEKENAEIRKFSKWDSEESKNLLSDYLELKAKTEDLEKMNAVQKKRIEETWELNQRYEKALNLIAAHYDGMSPEAKIALEVIGER